MVPKLGRSTCQLNCLFGLILEIFTSLCSRVLTKAVSERRCGPQERYDDAGSAEGHSSTSPRCGGRAAGLAMLVTRLIVVVIIQP